MRAKGSAKRRSTDEAEVRSKPSAPPHTHLVDQRHQVDHRVVLDVLRGELGLPHPVTHTDKEQIDIRQKSRQGGALSSNRPDRYAAGNRAEGAPCHLAGEARVGLPQHGVAVTGDHPARVEHLPARSRGVSRALAARGKSWCIVVIHRASSLPMRAERVRLRQTEEAAGDPHLPALLLHSVGGEGLVAHIFLQSPKAKDVSTRTAHEPHGERMTRSNISRCETIESTAGKIDRNHHFTVRDGKHRFHGAGPTLNSLMKRRTS